MDRCDRCPAAAHVEVALPYGTFTFCEHHWRENRHALEDAGAVIVRD